MYDSLKNMLYDFQSRNPLVYDIVLSDANITYVLQNSNPDLPLNYFTDRSYEILFPLLSYPNNDMDVNLRAVVNRINTIWIEQLRAESQQSNLTSFWKQSVERNHNINPEAIPLPLATSVKGSRNTFVLPVGLGPRSISGRNETQQIEKMFR